MPGRSIPCLDALHDALHDVHFPAGAPDTHSPRRPASVARAGLTTRAWEVPAKRMAL